MTIVSCLSLTGGSAASVWNPSKRPHPSYPLQLLDTMPDDSSDGQAEDELGWLDTNKRAFKSVLQLSRVRSTSLAPPSLASLLPLRKQRASVGLE